MLVNSYGKVKQRKIMYLPTQSEYNCAVHVAGYYVYAKHKL
jgi:hypothetical protein